MSIIEILRKIKDFFTPLEPLSADFEISESSIIDRFLDRKPYIFMITILIALLSFGLGRFSAIEVDKSLVTITTPKIYTDLHLQHNEEVGEKSVENNGKTGGEVLPGKYVGSKNSNKYHLPWCSGAQRITEANKIWFISKEDAEANGYIPAGNCEGI